MYISKYSGMDHTVLPANTPCLPFLRKRLPAAPTKTFYYLSFVSASAHVKQAVLFTASDEVSCDSIVDMIGCMRLTDVTRYEVRYDSDKVTEVEKNLAGG